MNAQSVAARVHESVQEPATELRYEGLVTRGIAFAIDAAIIDLVAIVVAGAVALVLSVLSVSKDALDTVLIVVGGALFLAWSVGYFVTFWSTTGQTPGSRLMRITVRTADDGDVLRPRRAAVRFVGLVLAAIPLLAGFVPILFDARRRGVHDMLAGTVVVESTELSRGSVPSPPRTPRR
jgi:uncharacterized RDD family membrane protein YckC